MEGCIAPSEVPGISNEEMSSFGKIAEDLIYMDFCTKYFYSSTEIYVDNNNLSSYLFFLSSRNPSLSLYYFATSLSSSELGLVRPDILIHSFAEKGFYEIKPNSA